jgi:hypothetical protein
MIRLGPILASFCALFLSGIGCAAWHVGTAGDFHSPLQEQKTVLVKKIDYDEHGRPLFLAVIKEPPSTVGDQYTVVQYRDNRPVQSFDMTVVGRKADMGRPLTVIYKWTGKGFQAGMIMAEGIAPDNYAGSAKEAAAYLVVKAAPVVVGSVSGFVVGLIASIPVTASELKNLVIDTQETMTSYTGYEYDTRGRLAMMRMHLPDAVDTEVVMTVFFYKDGARDPEKTEVTSYVENKVRTIP